MSLECFWIRSTAFNLLVISWRCVFLPCRYIPCCWFISICASSLTLLLSSLFLFFFLFFAH
jgi:hypothetical protein